jgi:Outer membrane protein beta-barrel domain
MRKMITLFSIAAIVLIALPLKAQKNYVQASIGYGFALAPRTITLGETINNYNSTTNTYSYSVGNRQSFGKGYQIAATVGHYINNNASLELGISYLMGSNLTDVVINNYNYTGQPVSKDIITTINTANMLRIMPGIRFNTGTKKCKPYLKAGAVLGIVTKFIRSHNVSGDNGTINTYEERKSTGDPSLGFYAGLGFTYQITKNLHLLGEALMIAQSWIPKKQVLIKSIRNGVADDISQLQKIYV